VESAGEFIVGWIVVGDWVSLPPRPVLGRERQEVGDEIFVSLNVLGSQATLVGHEDRGNLTRDHQVSVMSRVTVIQARSPVEPADCRGAVSEGEDARESAIGSDGGFVFDLEEDVDGHSEELEKVIDLVVAIERAGRRDPNAPGPTSDVPPSDPERTRVREAESRWLPGHNEVHGYSLSG
jgi:hypothetical protein